MMWLVLLFLLITSPAWSATYYVQLSPGTAATDCTEAQDIDTPHDTIAEGVACLSAGDTLYLRAGTYSERLVLGGKDGTSGSPITIGGYPGETVTLQPSVTAGNPAISGSTSHYITIQDLILDGTNMPRSPETNSIKGWWMDSISNWTIQRMEIKNFFYNGIAITSNSSNIIIRDNKIHDQASNCVSGTRWYGIYVAGSNYTIENNEIYNNPGGGVNIYPGPVTNFLIRRNNIHDNNSCTTQVNVGGILVGEGSAANAVSGVTISENTIHHNGSTPTHGGAPGINIFGGVDGTRIINNSIYANNAGTSGDGTSNGYGILLQTLSGVSPSNTTIINNIVTGNQTGQINVGLSTGTSISYSACLAGESCGATNKITLASSAVCFVSTTDLRLAQGANTCRDAGTSVTERPAPVGTTDVGAYEQGAVSSAAVSGAFIEVTVNVWTSPILPSTGITQFTITNGTSTGTPIVTQAVVKAGSSNVVQLSISGFTGSGTCTVSYGAGNLTDSGYVGPAAGANLGTAQGVNSASGVSVSGTCANTSGDPTPPSSGLYSEFLLDEGTGTTATDNTINGNDGTVSAGVTWVDDTSGTGVTIPSDTTYRHIASTHGQGVDLTANSLSACVVVLPDTQYAQKVVLSSGGNGTDQRFYAGWIEVGGVKQWGLGVQGSGMTTVTEFPLVAEKTLVCIRANAATDTVTLSVGRSIGTSAGAVKTYSTSLILVDNMRAGNDGTNTINTGGMTIYEMWVWNNTYVSDADVQALYDSIFAQGGSVTCYKQQDFQAQRVYLDGSSNPLNYGSAGAASIEVIAGGAVALVMQVDCTGSAGAPLAMQWLYSKNGGAYEHGIPLQFTADGIAMWGSDTDASLNRFTVADCVSGALTENYGPTQLVAGATPTIELSQDHSYCIRAIIKVKSDQAGNYFQIRLYQDNGAALAGGYTATPRIDVVAPRASGGF